MEMMTFHSFYFLGRRRESYGGSDRDRSLITLKGIRMIESRAFAALGNWSSRAGAAGVAGVRIKTPGSACLPGSAPESQRHRDIQKNALCIGKPTLGLRRENGDAIASLSALEIVGIEDDKVVASKRSEARGHDLAVNAILPETRN
jgi:hypothetical protein